MLVPSRHDHMKYFVLTLIHIGLAVDWWKVYHLVGVIKTWILRHVSLRFVSTFWSLFVALSSASRTISMQSTFKYSKTKSVSFS